MMELRETLLALSDEELFEKVLKLNPNFPELNRRRAIRFLELQTFGSTMKIVGSDYDFLLIGLNAERKVLYDRINQRVDQMMSEGFCLRQEVCLRRHPMFKRQKELVIKNFSLIFQATLVWKMQSS